MKISSLFLHGTALAFLLSGCPLLAVEPVIVHEWGTFTSLQDLQGKAIGGINVDDEPVPSFVHSFNGTKGVEPLYSQESLNFGLPPYSGDKSWISGDPAVTLRLETPVLYIYPPKDQSPQSVPPLDVHVDFHGGVLSQFFPYATAQGSVIKNGTFVKDTISEKTTSELTWKDVRLGATGKAFDSTDMLLEKTPWWRGALMQTSDKVWTTPREVNAPLLQVKYSIQEGETHNLTETERFLFYRGVGHLDSPLRLDDSVRGAVGTTTHLKIFPSKLGGENYVYDHAWLVEIHSDGTTAFRPVPSFGGEVSQTKTGAQPLAAMDLTSSGSFKSSEFNPDNLARLKDSMQAALVKEGLYPDEASAMLRTWELSYFKSPGMRFFYMVPREWVDRVLPLKITGAPTKITRVMIGRIELITDEQRAALARLAAGPCPDLKAVRNAAWSALQGGKLPKEEVAAVYRDEKPLSTLGIAIPPLVKDYLSLGRFRDPLIIHEQQLNPSPALAQFIQENNLAGR